MKAGLELQKVAACIYHREIWIFRSPKVTSREIYFEALVFLTWYSIQA